MKLPSMHVLLVEDDPADAGLITALLQNVDDREIVVHCVHSLAEAQHAIASSSVDVVLTSLVLRDLSGVQIVSALHDIAGAAPTIALTRPSDNGLSLEAMRAGAQDYLVKEELDSRLLSRALRYAVERKQVLEKLRRNEEQYRRIVETAHDGICVIDANNTTSFVNRNMAGMLGYTVEEMSGMPLSDFVEHGEAFLNAKAGQQENVGQNEFLLRRKDGSPLWAEVSTSSIVEGGRHIGTLAMVKDVSARRSREEKIRTLTRAVEQSPVAIVITDPQGNIEYVNPSFSEVTGFSAGEAAGKNMRIVKSGNMKAEEYARLWETITSGGVWQGELLNKKKDGTLFWEQVSISPVRNMAGTITHFVGVKEDITRRKEAEEALRTSEEKYRLLFQSNPQPMWVYDIETLRFLDVNNVAVERYGYSRAEFLGMTIKDIRPEEDIPKLLANIRNATNTFEKTGTWQHRKKDGAIIDVQITSHGLLYGGKRARLVLAQDVTQRRRFEEQLRESELRLRQMAENIHQVFWITDPYKKEMLYVSPAYEEIWKRRVSELYRSPQSWADAIHPEDRDRVMRGALTKQVNGTYNEIYRIIRPDGSIRWIHDRAFPVKNAAGEVYRVTGIAEDITERRQAEENLHQSEERYRRFFDDDLSADFIATTDGTLLACNSAFLQLFGFSSVHEALQANTTSLFANPERYRDMLTLLRREKKIEAQEEDMRRRDGSPLHVICNVVGRFDEQGELFELTGYVVDDTKRKLLEEKMIQMQKLESLGTLAGGIAHDFNNILGIIMGHSMLLNTQAADPKKLSLSIDHINKAVVRGTDLVRQILTFARKHDISFQPLDIHDLIRESMDMLKETFPKTIEFTLRLGNDIPAVAGDKTQLHQTLLNLSVNARDAMPQGGTLTIETEVVEGESLRAKAHAATAQRYVHVLVSDTGVGMDEATRKRIFEPFFTTKEKGKGTGLGLSVVYGIMKSHHGIVDVESTPGEGTTFHVYLPVPHDYPDSKNHDATREELPRGGSETVLIVEDEHALQELLHGLLTGAGYRVLRASDGLEAIELFQSKKQEIALVITDLGLPKMSGLEIVKRLRAINPGVKVIFASGYLDPNDKQDLLSIGAQEFVEKPYDPNDLMRKIRSCLDTPPGPAVQ